MTTNSEEPPVVGLDRSQTQSYAQAAMALGWMLRERRQQRGKLAWSEAEAAARAHDEMEGLIHTPPVRRLTPVEAREATAWADARSVTDQHDELRVRIKPTQNGRWILEAEIGPLHLLGDTSERMRVSVSCDSEARARDLAEELAAAGPDRELLTRLAGHTDRTDRRRRGARREVSPDREQWLETVTEAAQETWSPEVAAAVVDSSAFGALAHHTRTLAERGYNAQDILARIPEADLSRAKDAGALAAWFARELTDQLVVIDADQTAAGGPTTPDGPHLGDVPRRDVDRAAAETLLREAVPNLADQLVACRAWPALARTISDGVQAGQPVERILAGLPQDAIVRARKPAAYVTSLLQQVSADHHQASARREGRPWPPSPRPRTKTSSGAVIEGNGALDPASAVDRVLLDTTRPPAAAGEVADPAGVASHNDAARDAEAAADRTERAASHERLDPGHAGATDPLDDAGAARADEDLAANQHAAAGEEHSAAAAARRAEVPLTPAVHSPSLVPVPGGPRPAPARPGPIQTPVRQPRRHR